MQGIDISNWQGGLDVGAVPCDFVICKATEGTGFIDRSCDVFISKAREIGKPFGFYHFATSEDPIAQADFFVDNTLGYFGHGIPVLDWEASALALGPSGARSFLDRVLERTGVKPMIYMSKSVCNQYDWSSVVSGDYGLWVAQYANYNRTGYQDDPWTDGNGYGAWGGPAMFQYSSSGLLDNWNGNLDLDVFYGDVSTWNAYAGASNNSNNNNNNNEEDDMAASDVWNYGIGTDATPGKDDVAAWQRLSWIHHDSAALYASLCRTDDAASDGTNGDMYTRVCYMDKRIRELSEVTVPAMETAIKALSEAKGADADEIAEAVKKAVADKLATIELSVTTSGD